MQITKIIHQTHPYNHELIWLEIVSPTIEVVITPGSVELRHLNIDDLDFLIEELKKIRNEYL